MLVNAKYIIIITILLMLIASEFPNILFHEIVGNTPQYLSLFKLLILVVSGFILIILSQLKNVSNFAFILAIIVASHYFLSDLITFDSFSEKGSYINIIGKGVFRKFVVTIPVILVLFIMYKNKSRIYLTKGDLNVKASEIQWLGIKGDTVNWLKLSLWSAFIVSTVTIFLTIFTVTGFSSTDKIHLLAKYFPVILLFALVNSFSEGVFCRNAVLSTLKDILPKSWILIIAGVYFGIWHYFGTPAGVVGVIMSSFLGWYLSRSMYETKGVVSSWLMHLIIDITVFSSLFLFGEFSAI